LTDGPDRVAHRALLFSCGLTRGEMSKPLVAIVNSWNEIVPGCIHLRAVAQAVREGVLEAGGVPLEFNTIGVCDGLAQGHVGMKYSLPSREIIAASSEIMLEAHQFDAAVFISSCDKITPGMLMAAARVNIPSIMVPAGAMKAGEYEGQKISLSQTREFAGKYHAGKITAEELARIEEIACPSPGTCAMMGTANSMACLTEALGMSLPTSATMPATSSAKLRNARESGMRLMQMLEQNLRPLDIITSAALENALRVTMAIGGSTNTILHLLGLAQEIGVPFDLRHVDEVSRTTPYIAKILPSGPNTIEDLHSAGGIPAVLKSIRGLLQPDAVTVSGKTIGEVADASEWHDTNVIHSVEDPIRPDGGLAVLWGNLAPEGSLVKKSAATPTMWVHEGQARVFDSMEDAIEVVEAGGVEPGSVVVIRYEGPVGGPGMREMQMITAIMSGMGLSETTALVTDGRFSGSTRGPCIGYVSPEAALGGPLALVEEGDRISLDIPAGRLELLVAEDELTRRRENWTPPQPPTKGVLGLYASLAQSAAQGAVLVPKCE
jgi:dihydroxy-acid dehydratase